MPGCTAWLLHWENWLLGQRDQARRSSGVHSGKLLPCRSPWPQPQPACPDAGDAPVHTTPHVEPAVSRAETWEVSNGLGPSPVSGLGLVIHYLCV